MYSSWISRMAAAGTPAARRAVVEDMCRVFAFSTAKAYRILHGAGWESCRAKRHDAGKTMADEKLVQAVGEMINICIRKNGKATLPVNVARSILEARGVDVAVGDRRLRELLREKHISIQDAQTATPHQTMRSEYPNQVHFADPSVSLLYYAPSGKQKIIGDNELYKNKNYLEGKDKCWRYVLTDHYSASICVRYYISPGETAANMYDFLLYAWGKKDFPAYVFHGVPELLVWDCGTANIAKAISNALQAFKVKTIPHLPGNPRAKGQVECANNLVECHFESRLRFEPVTNVDALNASAEKWCAAYNANLLQGLDTRLERGGKKIGSRAALWQKIPHEKLRELPDEQTCRQVFANGIQTRKVAGDLSIGIVHPKAGRSMRYSLRDLPGILVGMRVDVQPLLVSDAYICIVAYTHERKEISFEVAPIQYDEAGFDITAPVFGQEYKRPKDTEREKARKALPSPEALRERNAAIPVMGAAHSFIDPKTPFMRQTTGTQIEVAQTVKTHEIIISAVEAAKRYKAALGEVPEGFVNQLREGYPEGVPARVIDNLIHEARGKSDRRNYRDEATVYEGGKKDICADAPEAPAQMHKIA